MLRRRVINTIVVALMCLLVGVASSGASSSADADTTGLSAVELVDMEFLADWDGISLQEAIARYAWQGDFVDLIKAVRIAAPEAFAGAKIVNYKGVLSFVGEVPEAVQSVVKTFRAHNPGVSIDIQPNRGFTDHEIGRAVEAIHYALLTKSGVVDASTSFDAETETIKAYVSLSDDAPSVDDLQAIANAKLVQLTGEAIMDHVTIEVSEVSLTQPILTLYSSTKHMGGEHLDGGVDGDCTSGFAVSTTGGTRGVATAGHCGDDLEDDNVALDFKEEHIGLYGDIQWHTGDHPTPNRFYAGDSVSTETATRDVRTVDTPRVGLLLCKNGRNTHRTCDTVRKVDMCVTGRCSLMQMNHQRGGPGDSGGPVYSGSRAYGFVTGSSEDPAGSGVFYDVNSKADQLDNALGLYILTD